MNCELLPKLNLQMTLQEKLRKFILKKHIVFILENNAIRKEENDTEIA